MSTLLLRMESSRLARCRKPRQRRTDVNRGVGGMEIGTERSSGGVVECELRTVELSYHSVW